jgi:hypothetical protein
MNTTALRLILTFSVIGMVSGTAAARLSWVDADGHSGELMATRADTDDGLSRRIDWTNPDGTHGVSETNPEAMARAEGMPRAWVNPDGVHGAADASRVFGPIAFEAK